MHHGIQRFAGDDIRLHFVDVLRRLEDDEIAVSQFIRLGIAEKSCPSERGELVQVKIPQGAFRVDRVQHRGIDDRTHQDAFGVVQLTAGFVQVKPGGSVQPEGHLTKPGRVVVPLQDLFIAVGPADLPAQHPGGKIRIT